MLKGGRKGGLRLYLEEQHEVYTHTWKEYRERERERENRGEASTCALRTQLFLPLGSVLCLPRRVAVEVVALGVSTHTHTYTHIHAKGLN
jgi:hypothetical protein